MRDRSGLTRWAVGIIAIVAAPAWAETPGEEHQAYAKAVGALFAKQHGETVKTCVKGVPSPQIESFALTVQVAADGVVGSASADPATNVAGCVCDKLKGWKLPAPPAGISQVTMNVGLKK